MIRISKNTPRLDIIDEWIIQNICDYLETQDDVLLPFSNKYQFHSNSEQLVRWNGYRKRIRHIAEDLLIDYETYNDIRQIDKNLLTKSKCEVAFKIKRDLDTLHSNVYDNIKKKKMCSMRSKKVAETRKNNGLHSNRWKGDRILISGYYKVTCANHPKADSGNRVWEHVLVAEKKIGRFLYDNEVVHHINGNKQDNSPDNLHVMDKNEHSIMHTRLLQEWYSKNLIKWDSKKGEYCII